MKKRGINCLLLFFIVVSSGLSAQQEAAIDTAYYNRIEPVLFRLSKYPHGIIQWQESKNEGISWMDIPGANENTLSYSTDTSVYIRALITSGTCDSIVTQYSSLRTIRVFTEGVDSISDSSAWVHCEFDAGDVVLAEYGLLYGTQPEVDENADRILLLPPVEEAPSIILEGLDGGDPYYVRAYGATPDGHHIFGNTIGFSLIQVIIQQNHNISKDSAWIRYDASGVAPEDLDEHGIFINTVSASLPTSVKVPGFSDDGQLTSIAGSLSAGTEYFVQAYIRSEDRFYYSQEKSITTWSSYGGPVDTTTIAVNYRIDWNEPSTAVKLNPTGTFGEYARVERLGDSDTLLLVYHGGPNTGDWINIYLRKSYDNGTTWTSQETIMDLADYPGQYWRFCTPEILYLQNGWILVAFEANARPDENKSSVQILVSKDSGQTWADPIIYETGRTWEPAMVQLPHGEIELFYSSEAKWWPGDPLYQDIQVIRSTDNGESWSDPQVVAYYPNKRDGMPVPLVLDGNKGVAIGIETVGSDYSPYIVHRDMDAPWILTDSDYLDAPHRWWINGFLGHGGAPYILQLPTGEVVCSAHIYRGGDWHQNNFQKVMVGDNNAQNFEGLTYPWGILPVGESAINNSLFMKDESTIVTISTRMLSNGTGGIYWLEGAIVPK